MSVLHDKLELMDDPVMTKYKVVIDKDKCIGSGSCVDMAGLTFRMGEERKASLIDQDGNGDEEKLMAAKACPNSAIKIINTASGEVMWPARLEVKT